MLRLDSLSQAGTPRYLGPDGTAGAARGRPPGRGRSRLGSAARCVASWLRRVRAAFGSGPETWRQAVAWPAPRQPRSSSLTRVISGAITLVAAGPISRPAPAIAASGHLQNGVPLCSAVASQRDASGSGCGTDCQWKPRVQAGQQAMRLAPFLLPIEQSRPRRSPRPQAVLVPPPVPGPAAGLAGSRSGRRGCALTCVPAKCSRQLPGSAAQPRYARITNAGLATWPHDRVASDNRK